MTRVLLTTFLIAALASSASAGDPAHAAAAAAPEQPAPETNHSSRWFSTTEVWAGTALMAGGLAMAFYGFGHPTGPVNATATLTDPESFPHDRALGFACIAVAAAGGVLAWRGLAHTSIQAGRGRIVVQRRLSF